MAGEAEAVKVSQRAQNASAPESGSVLTMICVFTTPACDIKVFSYGFISTQNSKVHFLCESPANNDTAGLGKRRPAARLA